MKTLNEVFSSLSTRRRYEVWFVRLGLADGAGAWWFRYLIMNPGRNGCPGSHLGSPVQVWATQFRRDTKPQSFIQGYPLQELRLSPRGQHPFDFQIGDNAIGEDSCRGHLAVDGHDVSWALRCSSTFRTTMSDMGWIGFSRTAHSDAVFSGQITFDGQSFQGEPLGFGLQGHNCGYRHRSFWTWAHAYFASDAGPTTFEALCYDMPLGLVFRRAVLWHRGKQYMFRSFRNEMSDRQNLRWTFRCSTRDAVGLQVEIDGGGRSIHRLPYLKTDCSGSFEVVNNSTAAAAIRLAPPGESVEHLATADGAVLEMGGSA